MDAHTLIRQFCHVVSFTSLACVFSGIHKIQYSLLDHNMMDVIENCNLQENDSTSHSGFTSTPNTSNPANTSSNSGKASGCWTDQEITLLLNYVKTHCSLNTPRGLNLKKTQFNKAQDTVKSKDASQCHYKWGHVHRSIIDEDLSCWSSMKALQYLKGHFTLGQEVQQWMAWWLWCQSTDCSWEAGFWWVVEDSWGKPIW